MVTATTYAPTKPVVISMLGGQYEAECGPDGKYSIKGIEFFSTHKKGENGVNTEVTDEKITEMYEALVENSQKHLLPVNIYHHEDPQHPIVQQIAYFMPRQLKKAFVNGRDRLTIFGDMVGLEKYDFNDIRAAKLPFRSPEVLSFKENRFRALALLKDQVGYYEYPMLTVGSVTYSGSAPSLPMAMESPMLAYRAGSTEDNLLFCYAFGANDKGDDKKKKKPGDKKKTDEKKKNGDDDKGGEPGFGEGDGEQDAAGGEEGEEGEAGEEGESAAKAMSSDEKLDKILAIVTQLMKDSCPSENDVNGNKAPSQDAGSKKTYAAKKEEAVSDSKDKQETVPAAGGVAGAASTEAKPGSEKAQIQADAKYAALSEKLDRTANKVESKEREEKAIADLEASGFRLTKETRAKVAHYAAKSEESLKDFVDTFKLYAEKDPPQSAGVEGAASIATASGAGLPEEVAAYAAKNPQDKNGISFRAKLFPEYQAYKASGGTIPSFDRYVAAEMAAAEKRMSLEV